jgi:hypothetical protein
MDVEKILIIDDVNYSLSRESFDQTVYKIGILYEKIGPQEKLVMKVDGSKSKFEVCFSMGDGIIVAEHKEIDGEHVAGLKVTFRKKGDIRIDDPNQISFMSGAVLFTYHGICNQDGEVKLFTKNDNKAKATQADRLLNLTKGPLSSWLNPVGIRNRYKDAVSTAIDILKKLPQT